VRSEVFEKVPGGFFAQQKPTRRIAAIGADRFVGYQNFESVQAGFVGFVILGDVLPDFVFGQCLQVF
jgi:hypothetical protein